MPAKIDKYVAEILKKPNFKPNASETERKSAAFAICKESQNKNSEVNILDTLMALPPNVLFDIEDGMIRLSEDENYKFCDDEEEEDGTEEASYNLYFSENEKENHRFSSFNEISLKDMKKNKRKDDDDNEEEETEIASIPIEMLREGTFKHPFFGDLVINRKMFLKFIENFVNDILEREISFDVSHNPDLGAYGWLRKMELKRRTFKDKKRRYVLIGDTELTEEGEELIAKKKFKYFSIEYADNHIDKENEKEYGPTVFGGALTNRPFINGMRSIKMSEDADNQTSKVCLEEGSVTEDSMPVESESNTQLATVEGTNTLTEDKMEVKNQKTEIHEEQKTDIIKTDIKNLAAEKQSRPSDNDFPNAAFALIKRDAKGNIIKRSLPHHGPQAKSPTENTTVDLGKLRNALARIKQVTGFSSEEKSKGLKHLEAHAKVLLTKRKASSDKQGEIMNVKDRIEALQVKLNALEDQDNDLAKSYIEEIEFLQTLSEDENQTQEKKFSEELNTKLSEQEELVKQLSEKNKATEEELSKLREERRQLAVNKYCDELEHKGHYTSFVKAVREVLLSEKTSQKIVTLSETVEDQQVEKELDLLGVVDYIVNAIPSNHKVDLSETFSHNENDEPKGTPAIGKIQLSDGSEVDLLDESKLKARITKLGYKSNIQ